MFINDAHTNRNPLAGLLIGFLLCAMFACQQTDKGSRQIVREWIGKEIVFPHDMVFMVQGDTVDYHPEMADYKIVCYIDSLGCTECQMRLHIWESLMAKFNSIGSSEVSLVMVVETSSTENVVNITELYDFKWPIVIDRDGEFNAINAFPRASKYRSFLTDSNNNVLAIGNPSTSTGIYTLYDQIIRGDASSIEKSGTRVSSDETFACLGVVRTGQTNSVEFEMHNNGDKLVVIDQAISSCDCTEAFLTNDTIPVNGKTVITIRYSADSIMGEANREVFVYIQGDAIPSIFTLKSFVK